MTFGNAIARAQVTVTKAAVSMKFLEVVIGSSYLRFLIVIGLSENQREKLVSEWVVVARESSEDDQAERTCSNQHRVVRVKVGEGCSGDDYAWTGVVCTPVACGRDRSVEDKVDRETTSYDHFDSAVARTHQFGINRQQLQLASVSKECHCASSEKAPLEVKDLDFSGRHGSVFFIVPG